MRASLIVLGLVCGLGSATLSAADAQGCSSPGSPRFGTLNLLSDEVAVLHVSTYPGDPGRSSEPCAVRIGFVAADGDVLQEGDYVLEPGRGLDVAFYGPDTGVVQFHLVIEALERCNVDVVPLLQIQEKVLSGTGKTRYLYSGQPSVPVRKNR